MRLSLVSRITVMSALAVLTACAGQPKPKPVVLAPVAPVTTPALPTPDVYSSIQSQGLNLRPTRYTDMTGWEQDDHLAALAAFKVGCATITRPDIYKPLNINAPYAGKRADWVRPCDAIIRIPEGDAHAARRFFELEFQPFVVEADGQVTGYYEPVLEARDAPDPVFSTPMLAPPVDLVTVDLGQFDPNLAGQKGIRRIVNDQYEPYPARAAISATGGQVLAWLRPGDLYFLQIQGSGRLHFPDGREMRAAFAAHNGRPYTSLGKILVDRKVMTLASASATSIADYLDRLPTADAQGLMNLNERYVFFSLKPPRAPGLGPDGGMGVPLTAGRSMAVDPAFHAYGAPIWVDAHTAKITGGDAELHRLMVAQDTGGAIKGPARGDLFWGAGPEALQRAGRYNHSAKFTVLIPARLAKSLSDSGGAPGLTLPPTSQPTRKPSFWETLITPPLETISDEKPRRAGSHP